MENQVLSEMCSYKMTNSDFDRLSKFIYNELGIKMPDVKKVMLQSRLQKRLRELEFNTFKEYIDYAFSKEGIQNEIVNMIDLVTTNKTDFFREPVHFDFLLNEGINDLINSRPLKKTIKIWSAGCSSGEEPYTISIVMSEFRRKRPDYDYSILATDLSTRVLYKAFDAVYSLEKINNIPLEFKKRYFLKSKDPSKKTARIIPDLRSKINFQRHNFMDEEYNIHDEFDIIFCRNVLIYFDRETQEKVISKLCTKLRSKGLFFLGHSESITNMDLPLLQIKPTIFKKI